MAIIIPICFALWWWDGKSGARRNTILPCHGGGEWRSRTCIFFPFILGSVYLSLITNHKQHKFGKRIDETNCSSFVVFQHGRESWYIYICPLYSWFCLYPVSDESYIKKILNKITGWEKYRWNDMLSCSWRGVSLYIDIFPLITPFSLSPVTNHKGNNKLGKV